MVSTNSIANFRSTDVPTGYSIGDSQGTGIVTGYCSSLKAQKVLISPTATTVFISPSVAESIKLRMTASEVVEHDRATCTFPNTKP